MALPKPWMIRKLGVSSSSEGLRLVFKTNDPQAGPERTLRCPLSLDEAIDLRNQLTQRIEEWQGVV